MTRALHGLRAPIIALLAIELLDELVFGARGSVAGVPTYSSALLEPVFGVLDDSRRRRAVVVGGISVRRTVLALPRGARLRRPAGGVCAAIRALSGAPARPRHAREVRAAGDRGSRESGLVTTSHCGCSWRDRAFSCLASCAASRRPGRLPRPTRRSSDPARASRRPPRSGRLREAAAALRSRS